MSTASRLKEIKKAQARIKTSQLERLLLNNKAECIWQYFRDHTDMSSGEITDFLFEVADKFHKFMFTDRRKNSEIKNELKYLRDAAIVFCRLTRIENGKFNEGIGLSILNKAIFNKIEKPEFEKRIADNVACSPHSRPLIFNLAGLFEQVEKDCSKELKKIMNRGYNNPDGPMDLPQHEYLSQKRDLSGYAIRAVIDGTKLKLFQKYHFTDKFIADVVSVFFPNLSVKVGQVNAEKNRRLRGRVTRRGALKKTKRQNSQSMKPERSRSQTGLPKGIQDFSSK